MLAMLGSISSQMSYRSGDLLWSDIVRGPGNSGSDRANRFVLQVCADAGGNVFAVIRDQFASPTEHLRKYTKEGSLVWTKPDSRFVLVQEKLEVDKSGNIIIFVSNSGSNISSIKLSSSGEAQTFTPHRGATLNGKIDKNGYIFIHCQYSSSQVTVYKYGNNGNEISSQELYTFDNDAVFGYNDLGDIMYSCSANKYNKLIYMRRVNANGTLTNVFTIPTDIGDYGNISIYDMAVDNAGNFYILYTIRKSYDGLNFTTEFEGIAKFSPSGSRLWAKSYTPFNQSTTKIGIDRNKSELFIAFQKTLAKLDFNGNEIWQMEVNPQVVSTLSHDIDADIVAIATGESIGSSNHMLKVFKS